MSTEFLLAKAIGIRNIDRMVLQDVVRRLEMQACDLVRKFPAVIAPFRKLHASIQVLLRKGSVRRFDDDSVQENAPFGI